MRIAALDPSSQRSVLGQDLAIKFGAPCRYGGCAERPGDLLDLASYWQENRRFGPLATMEG